MYANLGLALLGFEQLGPGRDHHPGTRNNHFRFASVALKRRLHKLALYSFFGARWIGPNCASAEYFKRIYILMTSLKTKIFEWSKNLYFQTEEIFDNCHMGRLFLSRAMRIKSSNFTSTLHNTRQKRKLLIAPKLMYRFFCSFVSWNSLYSMFTLFPLKQRKSTV